MARCLPFTVLAAGLLAAAPARAHAPLSQAEGSLVGVSVVVDGRSAPLYPARDGSGRLYLEAREGAFYEVRVDNRSAERVGVVLTVDGLNAISGDRELPRPGDHGRMYVLDPWESTTVRGWRTSLEEVRRFVFVDERASYAARSGKANARMGWIELAVYRERRPVARRDWDVWIRRSGRPGAEADAEGKALPAAPPAAPPALESRTQDRAEAASSDSGRPADSYPGTGWGSASSDRAVLVSFDPCPDPAERVTLRYEYASALRALGILPQPWAPRDRLGERERGSDGFAKPPRW